MSLIKVWFAESSGYNINNSLRFRSSASAYLNRTFTTPTSSTISIFSCLNPDLTNDFYKH